MASLLSGFFEGGGECLNLLQELEAIPSPAPSSFKQPSQRPGKKETGGTATCLAGGGYVGLGIGGRGGRGFWVRNPDPTLSPTPRRWVHSLIPGAAFHPDPNLRVPPNTQGNLSHRLTPQIYTHVPTDTHTRPCRGTDIQASLSFSLSFPWFEFRSATYVVCA